MSDEYRRGYNRGWHDAMNEALMIMLAVLAGYSSEDIARELAIVV